MVPTSTVGHSRKGGSVDPSNFEVTEPAGKPVLATIRSSFDALTRSDRLVMQEILERPGEVIHLTVGELAERTGVAESTVVRACHKLGFRGYQDLKIRLARESTPDNSPVEHHLNPKASPIETLRAVVAIQTEMLGDVLSLVDEKAFTATVDALTNARRIMIVGFGSSSTVAAEAEEKFASIGLDVHAPAQANRRILDASRLTSQDVMICVSQTGATLDTINYGELARRGGATVVAVTSFARTQIEKVADIVLTTGARDLDYRFGYLGGRTSHLVLLDAVYISVALRRGKEAADYLARYQDIESTWRL